MGASAPALAGARWSLIEARGDGAAALRREMPDILLVSADRVDAALGAALAEPLFAGLPIVLVAGAEDADAAGLLLDHALEIVDAPASPEALQRALADAAGRTGGTAVADAGAHYDSGERFAALRRDAERVAAALNDLVAGRPAEAARPVDSGRIRAHIRARRLRDRFFPSDLFADPVWDMLLDLAAARLENRQVSVSSLCIAAAVPTTTGLRWIKAMVDRGMLERSSDPSDARRSFIGMTAGTRQAVDACLDAVLNLPGQ